MKLARLPAVLCMLLRAQAAARRIFSIPSVLDSLSVAREEIEDGPSDLSHPAGPKVPGNNNLFLCGSDHDQDLCQIDEVDFTPDLPQR